MPFPGQHLRALPRLLRGRPAVRHQQATLPPALGPASHTCSPDKNVRDASLFLAPHGLVIQTLPVSSGWWTFHPLCLD